MNPTDNNPQLSRVLAEWTVAPRRDPAFRAAVQARIDRDGAPSSWSFYARQHAPLVVGTLALAMATGALTGIEKARSRTEADRAALAAAYVHALDARRMRAP